MGANSRISWIDLEENTSGFFRTKMKRASTNFEPRNWPLAFGEHSPRAERAGKVYIGSAWRLQLLRLARLAGEVQLGFRW
jgi:hypothetical protein